MTTNDDQYVPDEAEMRRAYWLTRMLDHHAAVDAAFDRFLAHVRRDAEAELDSWMARAYEAEGKLWKAEARIKAVEDALDKADAGKAASGWKGSSVVRTAVVRAALDGA